MGGWIDDPVKRRKKAGYVTKITKHFLAEGLFLPTHTLAFTPHGATLTAVPTQTRRVGHAEASESRSHLELDAPMWLRKHLTPCL